ncbi:MAG: OB-fold putative lipoprotein [Dorea sp.]|nr:OB-fold putative lipoprotein [Dorea sp.]
MKNEMKKVLVLIMVMVMAFLLCACGGGGSPATIVDNDGNTVQMTAEELIAIYDENEANYEKKYQGAEATVEGTVEKVDASLITFGSSNKQVYKIYLQEGWEIIVLQEFHDEVVNLSKGDKIKITSTLQLCSMNRVGMQDIGESGYPSRWHDDTTITIQ